MALRDAPAKVWFDEWIWLDDGFVNTQPWKWYLPPERWLDFGNTIQAQFIIDYWAMGPAVAAGSVNVGIEQSPVRTMDGDAWTYLMYPSQMNLIAANDSLGRIIGESGSPFDGYPRGWGRVMVSGSLAAGEWAVVRVRCSVRLQPADA